ncbi:MAG: hypothetical protein ACJAT4_000897 [Granulosicoccus sp.]|jgi:hypothetical protein
MRERELALCLAFFSSRVFGSFLPMQKEQFFQYPLTSKVEIKVNEKNNYKIVLIVVRVLFFIEKKRTKKF